MKTKTKQAEYEEEKVKSFIVDVLIPVYHPDAKFERMLKALALQNVPVRKLILMNTDEEWWKFNKMETKIPSKLEFEVHHVSKAEFDHGGTRKLAASFSDADILLFMTQDAVPFNSSMVKHLLEAFEDERTAVAYARQLPTTNCRLIEQYTRMFNYPKKNAVKSLADLPELGIKTYFASNVCAAYRRSVFVELGGFVDKTIFNEDMIFAARVIHAGYQIAYQASAQVIHSHNYSGIGYLHRNFDLGVSQAEFPDVFANVPAEGEGMKLVGKTAWFLVKKGKTWLIGSLVWLSLCKYTGYRLGKKYKKLPKHLVVLLSSNKEYWK